MRAMRKYVIGNDTLYDDTRRRVKRDVKSRAIEFTAVDGAEDDNRQQLFRSTQDRNYAEAQKLGQQKGRRHNEETPWNSC